MYKNDYVYIYNLEQAYFYIREGLKPISIGTHNKTNMYYFVFNKDKSNSIYTKWLDMRNKIKNNN